MLQNNRVRGNVSKFIDKSQVGFCDLSSPSLLSKCCEEHWILRECDFEEGNGRLTYLWLKSLIQTWLVAAARFKTTLVSLWNSLASPTVKMTNSAAVLLAGRSKNSNLYLNCLHCGQNLGFSIHLITAWQIPLRFLIYLVRKFSGQKSLFLPLFDCRGCRSQFLCPEHLSNWFSVNLTTYHVGR